MPILKVFISQPMKDKTNEEIEAERQKAVAIIKKIYPNRDIQIIDSFFKGAPHNAKPVWFLGKSIELLSTADVAYFCKGWENYRGCRFEHKVCEDYDVSFINYSEE